MSNTALRSLAIAVAVVLAVLVSSARLVRAQIECDSCIEDCGNDKSACEGEASCGFESVSCLQQCELAGLLCSLRCQDVICTPTGADLTGFWTSLTQTCKKSEKKKSSQCSLKGKFEVKNVGTEPAINAEVLFVLSADPILDATDIMLTRVNYSSSLSKQKKEKQLDISLPQGSSAAGKFVIAFIDSEGDVIELNETSNIVPFGPIP
jgi:hypothetical protein